MKKILPIFLLSSLLLTVLVGCKEETSITVLDAQGQPVENQAYVQIVNQELEDILMQSMGVSRERARESLKKSNFTAYTCYDSRMATALSNACKLTEENAGCAVTDLQGNLLAVYSSDGGNYAMRQGSPYGTLTPLSVYTPAFEYQIINWSTSFEDSSYMLLDDGAGGVRGWPSPSGSDYTYKNYLAYDALRLPVNTATVKCLARMGTDNAISFLEQRLGMDMATERKDNGENGTDATLSDLVFGFLGKGVTPVDMAGYYQIFANGGVYNQPKAVQKLLDAEGNLIYERHYTNAAAVQPETADLMNRMLQGVVSSGGTGTAAAVAELEVAGKTGSGSESNWFVGVTPGYSLAVWHGGSSGSLAAPVSRPQSRRCRNLNLQSRWKRYCR